MSTLLNVENLSKNFSGFRLNNISFKLEEGFLMGFIGRNGSGKTTVMKLIINAMGRNFGKIEINGFDNVLEEERVKNQVGFIMDTCPFFLNRTLEDNGVIFGNLYEDYNHTTFLKNLLRFKLRKDQLLSELSKGMEIKFQLAFAISHNPRLLIMDEPTGGLDPIFRREFLSILQELMLDEKIGILLSTHITRELDQIADYVTLIDKGNLIFSISKEELFERYKLIKGNKEELSNIPKEIIRGIKTHSFGFEALVEVNRNMDLMNQGVIVERPILEDIMYYLTKSN